MQEKNLNSLKITRTLLMLIFAMILNMASVIAQDVQWKKNFGGADSDEFNSVINILDGIIAVGSSGENSFDTGDWTGIHGKGGEDAIIVKFNNEGDVVWKKNFGGSSWDRYQSVTAIPDGIIAVGSSGENSFGTGDLADITGKGSTDAIIVKYDNNGNVVWKKNFGGSSYDFFTSVISVTDGIIVVGSSHCNPNVQPYLCSFGNGDWTSVSGKGNTDAIIIKYDYNGNVVWKRNFGGSDNDSYSSVTATSDGIIAVGRSGYSSFGNGDWIGITAKGSLYKEDAIIVKYDNSGNVVWKKNFGGISDDRYFSITTDSDGIIAVGESSFASFDTGDWVGIPKKSGEHAAIIVKYKNNGEVLWKKNFGGNSGADTYYSVTTIPDGIIAAGYARNSSFGSGDWEGYTGNGNDEATIVKYDNNGNVVWKKNFGGISRDTYSSVTTVSDGIVAVGVSTGGFGTGDWNGVTGKGSWDAIIVKYGKGTTSITDMSEMPNLKIYPNPTNDKFIVDYDGVASIKLYDMLGKEILTQTANGKTEINISHLPKGVYSVNVFSDGKIIGNSKIVK